MDDKAILAQSKAAYNQWAKQWREQAKTNSKWPMKSMDDFQFIGIGKAILCVGNGYSLEENIEVIRKNQDNVDILCCDKTLGHLLSNGITPTFCMVQDANVDFDRYMKPWADQLQNTILFMNVCANPVWAEKGNWKDKYFLVNKDIMGNEKEFSELSGCKNFIPAGTNVSNAMVVMLTQCDNQTKRNFFGYDKILLIGFDYSWRADGKYYAFNQDGDGKACYMKHSYIVTHDGKYGYTSGNLTFSAQWLDKYVRAFQLPVIQCSRSTIYAGLKTGDLEKNMKYSHRPHDADIVKSEVDELRKIMMKKNKIEKHLFAIEKDHWTQSMATV